MSRTENLVTLNSAMTQLMRSIRQVDEMQGIGRARLSALAVLHFGGPCNLSTLAEREMVTRATMHHVIAGLEQDALIRREPDPTDARQQQIMLTRRGRALIKNAHRARIDFLEDLAGEVSSNELAVAARVLDQLRLRGNDAWPFR